MEDILLGGVDLEFEPRCFLVFSYQSFLGEGAGKVPLKCCRGSGMSQDKQAVMQRWHHGTVTSGSDKLDKCVGSRAEAVRGVPVGQGLQC